MVYHYPKVLSGSIDQECNAQNIFDRIALQSHALSMFIQFFEWGKWRVRIEFETSHCRESLHMSFSPLEYPQRDMFIQYFAHTFCNINIDCNPHYVAE